MKQAATTCSNTRAVRLARRCAVVFVALLGVSGCDEPTSVAVETFDNTRFRLIVTPSEDCSAVGVDEGGDTTPTFAKLSTKLGARREEFVVVMASREGAPTFRPSSTRVDRNDEQFQRRVRAVANAQACLVASLDALGGVYVESFTVINALVAELTADQALTVARRADVISVELSEPHAR